MTAAAKPRPFFRILYFGAICLVVGLLVIQFARGLSSDDGGLHKAVLLSYLSLVFVAPPLLLIFLALNVWGLVVDKAHRRRYLTLAVLLMASIAWSVYVFVMMPFP